MTMTLEDAIARSARIDVSVDWYVADEAAARAELEAAADLVGEEHGHAVGTGIDRHGQRWRVRLVPDNSAS